MYWVSTSLISLVLLASGCAYFGSQSMVTGIRELGFPDFFRIQLGAMQVGCAIALAAPAVPGPVREWAYALAAWFFVTSIVAHVAHQDPIPLTLLNVGFLVLLAVSRQQLTMRVS